MSKPELKFAIFNVGGMGDSIKRYFGLGWGWEYITALKRSHPNSEIKCFNFSANPSTSQLFKYHPNIDSIIDDLPWRHPRVRPIKRIDVPEAYEWLHTSNITKKLQIQKQTKFYTTPEDDKIISSVAHDKFVIIHPFAGSKNRMIMPIKEFFPLIKPLKELGLNSVVVGANWERLPTEEPMRQIKESFDFLADGLINTIDKINSRIMMELVRRCTCLISIRSCCFSTVMAGDTNAVLLVSTPKRPGHTPGYYGPAETLESIRDMGFPVEKVKILGADCEFEDVRAKILNHVKCLI